MPELPPLRRPPLPRCPVPRESHFLSFSRRFDSARERRPCGALTSASLAEHWELHAVWSRMEQNDSILGSLKIAPDVNDALLCGNPVVALESTIISHGMPYPQNLQTAKEVQAILKANGAVPATIAILDGVPCIGLNNEQLERLAKLGSKAQKTARRDISHVVASGGNGATTVSATMFFASKVGIPVFVTGGVGGVHRHAETTMDISSDLTELGKTPMAVISAGVKSILDIPRTLEYLETQGVTVAVYQSNDFPAFFSGSSGCKVPCRLDTPEQCARLIYANMKLGLGSGMLIAVPAPEEHVAAGNAIESAIKKALEEAKVKNVAGNAATPFLLSRVNELTGGASLLANIALVKNNALIGARIAVALADLRRSLKNGQPWSAL
ncbi:pseudouridine-5'-phosphate glycosidase-like isoform X1 [Zingiber officinale]|uniref:pseudouridine-5'-phosphate glycosidase-like isoform X1 n=1 Tax=Zingiber officinale TaxID=94328 RepID=UPI001C4AACE5|nr:pseudouridine-5'-phosphate glycosidase-like isoform X1 [Zingiber officinale]